MIVKGEIGQQVLVKAEITAIEVSRDYRDNGVRTEYTLRLHESDALRDTYFKLLDSDVCFEVPEKTEVIEKPEEPSGIPVYDDLSKPAPKRGRPRKATVEDLVKRAKEES